MRSRTVRGRLSPVACVTGVYAEASRLRAARGSSAAPVTPSALWQYVRARSPTEDEQPPTL